jgi:hypothetical protein
MGLDRCEQTYVVGVDEGKKTARMLGALLQICAQMNVKADMG